jgi:hypothetical protein
MTWVTCQSPTSGETFDVNTRNVRRVVAKGSVSVVEFLDGTAIIISHTLDEWRAAVAPLPPQRIMQGVKDA